jgi:5'-deoxynucleotidase YfbR-like HD superfamily hydrolase
MYLNVCSPPIFVTAKICINYFVDEKYKRERLAIKYIGCEARRISISLADKIETFWAEFEERKTKEAQLVQSVNAFECLIQALEYEKRSDGKYDLRDFTELEADIVDPVIKEWAKVLAKEREAFWSQKGRDLFIVLVLGIYLSPLQKNEA